MNTVYIFGAGTSKGAGLPLINNFFEKTEDFRKKDHIKEYDEIKKNIDKHILDNNNIEEILGYLDMKIHLFNDNIDKNTKINLITVIKKTLYLSYYYEKEESKYFEALNEFVNNKLTIDDTIISFNYDILIDSCLVNNKWYPDYGIKLESYKEIDKNHSRKRISLFKLHGSLNWSICPECETPQWNNYSLLLKKYSDSDILSAKLYENFLANGNLCSCEKNHKKNLKTKKLILCEEDTLIVPPSWNKLDYKPLKELWEKAYERLKNADKIIFIGYSFPQTDIDFKYLLLSSLPINKNINVEVIDPNIQKIAGCYMEIFKDNISFKSKTFEEYFQPPTNVINCKNE